MSNKTRRQTTTQRKYGKPRRHTVTKKQKVATAKFLSAVKQLRGIQQGKKKTKTKKVPTKKQIAKFASGLKNMMVKNKTPPKIQEKSCTKFCKNVFIPEKERVEKKASKHYEPIEVLRKKEDKFEQEEADYLENMYLKSCNVIYCQKKCNNKDKTSWVKTIAKKRKERLMEQGAISGCRDLVKEFPDYYENI